MIYYLFCCLDLFSMICDNRTHIDMSGGEHERRHGLIWRETAEWTRKACNVWRQNLRNKWHFAESYRKSDETLQSIGLPIPIIGPIVMLRRENGPNVPKNGSLGLEYSFFHFHDGATRKKAYKSGRSEVGLGCRKTGRPVFPWALLHAPSGFASVAGMYDKGPIVIPGDQQRAES